MNVVINTILKEKSIRPNELASRNAIFGKLLNLRSYQSIKICYNLCVILKYILKFMLTLTLVINKVLFGLLEVLNCVVIFE